ncbi:MAG: class I SAM-dependent methyltransferase [Myxococcota bacterium]
MNKIIETYSKRADEYDDPRNLDSCWGRIATRALDTVKLAERHETVVDMGCGSGRELARLAEKTGPDVRFVGAEPAAGLRAIAAARAAALPNMNVISGRFEAIPLATASVDYLYSVLAFHWTTDLDASVAELRRVLGDRGEMDLTFIGKNNGREFIKATTPVFFRYVKPARLIEAAALRKQLSLDQANALFEKAFDAAELRIEESYHTFFDSLEGHWAWWVRIEGQTLAVPPEKKAECDAAVRKALADLETCEGIPYTVHLLHVSLRR